MNWLMYYFPFQKGNSNFITMVYHASMSQGNNVDLYPLHVMVCITFGGFSLPVESKSLLNCSLSQTK